MKRDASAQQPAGDDRLQTGPMQPGSGEGADTAMEALIRKRKLQGADNTADEDTLPLRPART